MIAESESAGWVVPEELRLLVQCGDEEVVGEFVTLFRSDTTSRLQRVVHALAAGDIAQVRAQAHAIKGSAIQVGAGEVAELSRQLELETAAKSPAEIRETLDRLQATFERVCGAMESCCGLQSQPNG
jgi:HPt (histidine-containing phosphotransfer) domain-containing protein